MTLPIALMNCFRGMFDQWKAISLISRTIARDPHHRKSPTRRKQDLNLRRTSVQALMNEVVQ